MITDETDAAIGRIEAAVNTDSLSGFIRALTDSRVDFKLMLYPEGEDPVDINDYLAAIMVRREMHGDIKP